MREHYRGLSIKYSRICCSFLYWLLSDFFVVLCACKSGVRMVCCVHTRYEHWGGQLELFLTPSVHVLVQ